MLIWIVFGRLMDEYSGANGSRFTFELSKFKFWHYGCSTPRRIYLASAPTDLQKKFLVIGAGRDEPE